MSHIRREKPQIRGEEEISTEEVKEAISKIKQGKSPGEDKINNSRYAKSFTANSTAETTINYERSLKRRNT